ncbi:hypothetical protein ACVW0B_002354 [Thermostichus sp. MS-CIW-23]|jgi:hypothetical protein
MVLRQKLSGQGQWSKAYRDPLKLVLVIVGLSVDVPLAYPLQS